MTHWVNDEINLARSRFVKKMFSKPQSQSSLIYKFQHTSFTWENKSIKKAKKKSIKFIQKSKIYIIIKIIQAN